MKYIAYRLKDEVRIDWPETQASLFLYIPEGVPYIRSIRPSFVRITTGLHPDFYEGGRKEETLRVFSLWQGLREHWLSPARRGWEITYRLDRDLEDLCLAVESLTTRPIRRKQPKMRFQGHL